MIFPAKMIANRKVVCKRYGKSYNKWQEDQAKPSHREILRTVIDTDWKRNRVMDWYYRDLLSVKAKARPYQPDQNELLSPGQ